MGEIKILSENATVSIFCISQLPFTSCWFTQTDSKAEISAEDYDYGRRKK
jgi:hypothetical protein